MNSSVKEIIMFTRAARAPRRRLQNDDDIKRVIRDRLVTARELNKLSQKDAATLLGYKNSSALSKVESGEAPPPFSVLRKASIAYGVSIDWLMGLSNQPERDPRNASQMAVIRAVNQGLLEHSANIATLMLGIANDQMPLEGHVKNLSKLAESLYESFERVCRKNPTFNEEIRGGATLTRCVDELYDGVHEVKRFYAKRQKMDDMRGEGEGKTLPLFGTDTDLLSSI